MLKLSDSIKLCDSLYSKLMKAAWHVYVGYIVHHFQQMLYSRWNNHEISQNKLRSLQVKPKNHQNMKEIDLAELLISNALTRVKMCYFNINNIISKFRNPEICLWLVDWCLV